MSHASVTRSAYPRAPCPPYYEFATSRMAKQPLVADSGCDRAQGFLFLRAAPQTSCAAGCGPDLVLAILTP
jgi:hypothetical protein